MVTFLLAFRLGDRPGGAGELVGARAGDPRVPGADPGLEALPPGAVAADGVPAVAGRWPPCRTSTSRRSRSGSRRVDDVERKQVLDAFTCVECGRCQVNCPAHGTGKQLNPKTLILQNEEALLAGALGDEARRRLRREGAVAVHDLRRVRGAVPGRRRAPAAHHRRPARARVERRGAGRAGGRLQPPRAPRQHLGPRRGPAAEVRRSRPALEIFDAARHEYLVWLGCAGSFEADFQKSLRSLFDILRARGVTFGVLAKERCTGDVAKRTGNEYQFQELARANIEDFTAAGVTKIVTSCPHCLRTIGTDYRAFGFTAEVVHSASLVADLTRTMAVPGAGTVTFHDPCYLGRYAGVTEEPRDLLARFGATVHEPERHGANPFCCGAGGGLLFEEHEEGRRISQERFEQLQAHRGRHDRDGLPLLLDHAEGRAGERECAGRVRRPDDLRRWPDEGGRAGGRSTTVNDTPALAAVPRQALPGRGDCRDRRPARRAARPHAALAGRRAGAPGRRQRAWPLLRAGLLARPHPADDLLLPRPRHRRHHEPEFRRRVDCAHHRPVRLRDGPRVEFAQRRRRPRGSWSGMSARAGRRRSRWTARGGRRARPSPARCGSPAPPGRRCCRSTSRPSGAGRSGAGIAPRSPSRSAACTLSSARRSTIAVAA